MGARAYFDTPVSRGVAMAVVLTQAVVNAGLLYKQGKVYQTVIDDQEERLRIYDETTNFLLARADGPTLSELSEKLEFWRVIRGRSVRPDN